MQFRDFLPVSTNTSLKESCYGALGAFVGLLGTALLCQWGLGRYIAATHVEKAHGIQGCLYFFYFYIECYVCII